VIETEKQLLQTIASNLKHLRVLKGLSQEELAFRAGIHSRHLQKIEKASINPTILSLFRLSQALETSLEDLIKLIY